MISFTSASRRTPKGQLRAPVAPTWSVNPSLLSAEAIEGGSTTCDPGTYDGTQPIYATFQWRESATSGGTYADMSGATSATYVEWAASATPWKLCRVVLTGPTGLTASYDTSSVEVVAANPPGALSYTLNWDLPITDANGDAATTLTSQKVYWSTDPMARESATGTATVSASATTYTISGLEAGTYYAWISAVNATGESEVSTPIEFVPA